MTSAFRRFVSALFRVWSAGLCIGTVALSASMVDRSPWSELVALWVAAAYSALGFGVMAFVFIGAARMLFRAQPGGQRDPVRKLAARLVRYRRQLVAALLTAAAVGGAGSFFLGVDHAATARTAVCGLVFLALRARHLRWFAGVRQASEGRVRFVASRMFGDFGTLFGGFLCFLGSLALIGVLREVAIPLTFVTVLGWFAWALPRRYVTVGKDGVEVSGWRDEFFSFDGSMLAQVHHDELAIFPPNRPRQINLHYGPMSQEERQHLKVQIEQRVTPTQDAAAAEGPSPADLAATLASLDGATGYRVAEVPRETLWRIVEAPLAPARVRLRAAELVAQDPEQDDLPRLRRLAETLAEPGTAEALERLACKSGSA